jgi:hypothetical protein
MKGQMLTLFPDPYPDELLYSVLARYSVRLPCLSPRAMEHMVFGDWMSRAPELPTSLEHLAKQLPPGLSYTADTLIQQHTLFPYYAPFLPRERIDRILNTMKNKDLALRHPILLLGTANVSLRMGHLHYCPVCVAQDRGRYGECYWHRLHQLTSVCVCPDHYVFLEDSGIDAIKQVPWRYIPADEIVSDRLPRPIDTADPHHQVLLDLATDTVWLLEHPEWRPGRADLHSRYVHLLAQQGYASYTQHIHWIPLVTDLEHRYPSALMAMFCAADTTGRTPWHRLLARVRQTIPGPYLHLLLMRFLGVSPAMLASSPNNYENPFGEGPWPCLNPVCPSYCHLVVEHCEIKIVYDKTRHPVGLFTCACGFAYRRRSPERLSDDRYRYDSVVAYGHLWEAHLREQWENSAVTLKALAQQFDMSPSSLSSHAYRLGCRFPRVGGRTDEPAYVLTQPQPVDTAKGEHMREVWQRIVAQNPERSVNQLNKEEKRVYRWLLQHDREWFNDYKTVSGFANKPNPNTCIDWNERDDTYALQVNEVAADIRQLSPPVRASHHAILQRASQPNIIRRDLSRLPKTASALVEQSESKEAFIQRKIWTAAEECRQERIRLSCNQFLHKAHVSSSTYAPPYKEMIDAALRYIETGDEQLKPPEFRRHPDQAVLVES